MLPWDQHHETIGLDGEDAGLLHQALTLEEDERVKSRRVHAYCQMNMCERGGTKRRIRREAPAISAMRCLRLIMEQMS